MQLYDLCYGHVGASSYVRNTSTNYAQWMMSSCYAAISTKIFRWGETPAGNPCFFARELACSTVTVKNRPRLDFSQCCYLSVSAT